MYGKIKNVPNHQPVYMCVRGKKNGLGFIPIVNNNMSISMGKYT